MTTTRAFQTASTDLAPLNAMLERLREPLAIAEVPAVAEQAFAICRDLYGRARSADALPLARVLLAKCEAAADRLQTRRAAMVCGSLSADTGDIVGAIEYHVRALRLAAADDDRLNMSGAWNNIGLAMGLSGNYEMAARCYRRSLSLVENRAGPVMVRFIASVNLADCLFQVGELDAGIAFGHQALRDMPRDFPEQDPYVAILLRRNLVRLLVAKGSMDEAAVHVAEAVALAGRAPSPRARIAAEITRASYELASGHADVALTRLEQALARSREVPATWRDTLVCVIRAEEATGHAARALLRLEELSAHVYALAVERAKAHLDLAGLGESDFDRAPALRRERAKARLASKLEPPAPPESWDALQRLAVGAVLRMDATGWHGMRVGALTKALALASGMPPLQALEVGLASQVHDIGLLSIPEAVLGKRSGCLNASEHALVRRHVDAGGEMLGDDGHPRVLLAREIARYHHARWDGAGYPERVGGPFIPLGARLCAIADAYDIMVCGLGGREPRTMDSALRELARNAGSQFDPELAAAFEAMVRSESRDLGVDLTASAGMEGFQELVLSLQEDRGFV